MNLAKLFEVQKVLRDRINYNEPDRFNKLVLALLVELGECANEWRGFKFWSLNQNPVTYKREHKKQIKPGLESFDNHEGAYETVVIESNPLLEEYVDGLHFVLELGIELGFEETVPFLKIADAEAIEGFTAVYRSAVMLEVHRGFLEYHRLLSVYIRLGVILGFTWEQIEEAYMAKNAVNHQRQSEGY